MAHYLLRSRTQFFQFTCTTEKIQQTFDKFLPTRAKRSCESLSGLRCPKAGSALPELKSVTSHDNDPTDSSNNLFLELFYSYKPFPNVYLEIKCCWIWNIKKKKKKQWSEKCRALALRLSRGGRAMATGGGQLTDTSACHSHKEQMCINKHLCNHFTRVPLSFVSNLRDFFLQCKDFSSSHKISELLNNSPAFRSHCCSIPQLPIAVCTRGYANKQET